MLWHDDFTVGMGSNWCVLDFAGGGVRFCSYGSVHPRVCDPPPNTCQSTICPGNGRPLCWHAGGQPILPAGAGVQGENHALGPGAASEVAYCFKVHQSTAQTNISTLYANYGNNPVLSAHLCAAAFLCSGGWCLSRSLRTVTLASGPSRASRCTTGWNTRHREPMPTPAALQRCTATTALAPTPSAGPSRR